MREDMISEGALQNALFPSLQKSFSPRPQEEDRLLIFLASAAHEDNCLTHHSWQTASAALRDIFTGGESSFPIFQSKFHAALMMPPVPPGTFINDKALASAFFALPEGRQMNFRRTVRALSSEYTRVLNELLKKNGISPGSPEDEDQGGPDQPETFMENGIAGHHQPSALALLMQKKLAGAGAAAKNLLSDKTSSALLRDLDLRHVSYGKNKRQCTAAQRTAMDAEEAALALDSAELFLQCEDTLRLVREQPPSFAVIGEVKKGKSSLVNALLGKDISPVKEATATTSAVINFRWGKNFRYKITYADKKELDASGEYREFAFNSLFSDASDGDHWTLNESRFSDLILHNDNAGQCAAVLDVELPSPLLRQGIVLTDTPGLNFPSSMQQGLARHAGYNADCVIFVMDAEMPLSSAGTEYLRSMSGKGRATHIIGVVTNLDRLSEQDSRENALKAARAMMAEASAAGLVPLGLFPVHAGQAMKARCGEGGTPAEAAFARLLDAVGSLCRDKSKLRSSRSSLLARRSRDFEALAKREAERFYRNEMSALPDAQHIAFLTQHKGQLHKVFEQTVAQAQSVISAAEVDIETWRKAQFHDLEEWEENAALKIMDAIRRHADDLGSPEMFNPKNWEEFDKTTGPRIAEEAVQAILSRRNEAMHDWNQKLHRFDGALKEISVLCLDAVMIEEEKLAAVSGLAENHAQFLVRANTVVKNLGLVGSGTVLGSLGGAGFGIGVVLAGIGWWAIVPVAFASGLYALLRHFGNPERCRKIFFKKREEAVREWAAKQKARLQEFFEKTLEEVIAAYRQAAEKSFLPAASMLAEEEASLGLYLNVMEKIRGDAEKKAAAAAALAGRLSRQIEG